MPTTYAIRVIKNNLDLIQVLNSGVRPLVQKEETYYLFTCDSPTTTTDHKIISEDNLYDEKGYTRHDITFV